MRTVSLVVALVALCFIATSADALDKLCNPQYRCSSCIGTRDQFGVKCKWDLKDDKCKGSYDRLGPKYAQYVSECAGARPGANPNPGGSRRAASAVASQVLTAEATKKLAAAAKEVGGSASAKTAPVAGSTKFEVNVRSSTTACHTAYRDAEGKLSANPVVLRLGCTLSATLFTPALPDKATVQGTINGKTVTFATTFNSNGSGQYDVRAVLGSASDSLFGEYELTVVDGAGKVFAKSADKVLLVFNPYDSRSGTFISDAALRQEIIENEQGAMWTGSTSKPVWQPWAYDQYDYNVWSTAVKLFSKLPAKSQTNLPAIVRELSGKVGSDILEGKWGATGYEDADTAPWQWHSSSDIFRVVATKNRRAKYGQCMIFSCVTASLFRALGIGALQNTAYDFVQEKGGDLKVQIFFKPDATGIQKWDTKKNDENGEKLWNFHAWTIVYIHRPDIGKNAVTPQIADGTWHAGPGDIESFKAGKLDVPYSLKDYNPSINSQVIYNNLDPKTGKYVKWADPFIPSNSIMTTEWASTCPKTRKDDGSIKALCRKDIAPWYKTVKTAVKTQVSFLDHLHLAPGEKARASKTGGAFISFIPDDNRMGNDFTSYFKTQDKAVAKIVGAAFLETYDGRTLSKLKDGVFDAASKKNTISVTTADFANVPKAELAVATMITAVYSAFDASGALVLFDQRKMTLIAPNLNMLCGKKAVKVGDRVTCNINFSNPFPFPLRATLTVGISGSMDQSFKPQTITIPAKAGANKEKYRGWFKNVAFKATTPGDASVMASIKAVGLGTVAGAMPITIAGTLPMGKRLAAIIMKFAGKALALAKKAKATVAEKLQKAKAGAANKLKEAKRAIGDKLKKAKGAVGTKLGGLMDKLKGKKAAGGKGKTKKSTVRKAVRTTPKPTIKIGTLSQKKTPKPVKVITKKDCGARPPTPKAGDKKAQDVLEKYQVCKREQACGAVVKAPKKGAKPKKPVAGDKKAAAIYSKAVAAFNKGKSAFVKYTKCIAALAKSKAVNLVDKAKELGAPAAGTFKKIFGGRLKEDPELANAEKLVKKISGSASGNSKLAKKGGKF